MGAAVAFVLTIATIVTYLIQKFVLDAFGLEYLQTIAFILVIAALVQMVEIILKKVSPALYQALGVFLPLITTNCCILGVAILVIQKDFDLLTGVVYAFSTALGFALAMVLFAGIREQLSLVNIPKGMQGMAIALVTAGLLAMAFMGFFGSHTVVELQNAGYEVVIIDNLSNSSADVVDNIEKVSGIRPAFEELDCLDYAGLDAVFTKYKGIKAIIHFAASKAVGESVQKPLLYYRNNLVSLINLLELMPKHGVEGIVFSSSCTVYGQPDELPVTEKAPIKKAESPYGNTKQINEEIVRDTVASGAPINAILLRYFNPIGAHPTALLGELPNGVPQNLIPYLTQTAIGIREKLSVFGDDYDTPDGSCIRDFINVVDLAKAHVVAIRRILENKQKEKVEVFNIGTGRGLSVLELINAFEKATGVKLNYQIVGRRAGDIEKVWANPELANNELGWKAETSIEDTLLSAWKWQLKLRERGIQ